MTTYFYSLDNQCDLLLDPVNGEVHQTGRYLGDRAIYTCGHGWEIVGAEERVCQEIGEWTDQEPYCKKRGKRIEILPCTWGELVVIYEVIYKVLEYKVLTGK